jgi:S-formylglutathione hydrolase FrmB
VRRLVLAVAAVAVASAVAGAAPGRTAPPVTGPPGFTLVERGPAGGSVWQGVIPNGFVRKQRLADVYLPPGYAPDGAYRVVYLLHGFWGAPSSFVDGMHIARIADEQIASGRAAPFIAVIPPAGPSSKTANEEWAGIWEDYVVRDVVPWADSHLATDPTQRTIAGISAGGFGAVDIGLRHPGMFDILESFGGYFRPFRDGPFTHATLSVLDAHDPTLLVHERAAELARDGTRFFVSTGRRGHGAVHARWTFAFAELLSRLHLRHELWVMPRAESVSFWTAQFPAALDYGAPVGATA